MQTTQEKLEILIAKLRALPADRQEYAVEAIAELTEDDYVLSNEERAILEPALRRAERGEFVPDHEMNELLDKPWC